MTTETLRRAASLIRDRSSRATYAGYGWRLADLPGGNEVWANRDAAGWDAFMVASTATRLNPNPGVQGHDDAVYIASWHPGIAAAAAAWLEAAADWRDANPDDVDDDPDLSEVDDPALAFARAYLGEQP
jgi:hypothetical protein